MNYRTAPSTPRGWRGPKRTKGSRDLTSSHSRMPGMVTGLVDPAPSLLDCRFVATSAAPGGFAALLGGVVDTASHHTAPRHICLSICTAWRGAAEGSTDAAPRRGGAADTAAAPAPTATAGRGGAADAGSSITTAGRRGTTEVSITATGMGDTEEGADLGSTAAAGAVAGGTAAGAAAGGTAAGVVVAGTAAGTGAGAGRSATCAARNARRTAASEDRIGQPSHSCPCRSPPHSCLGSA